MGGGGGGGGVFFFFFLGVLGGVFCSSASGFEGLDAEAAGVEAFHVAAKFTLAIAMPVWLLYAIRGWLRRRSLPRNPTAAAWPRWLPIVLVRATMIFLARGDIYFDSLKPR